MCPENRVTISTFVYNLDHYRVVNMTCNDYSYYDINIKSSDFTLLGVWAGPADYVTVNRLRYRNTINPLSLTISYFVGTLKYNDVSFENINGNNGRAFYVLPGGKSNFENIRFDSYNSSNIASYPLFDFSTSLGSEINLNNIQFENCWIFKSSLLVGNIAPELFIMKDITFQDFHFADNTALVDFILIKAFKFDNITFENTVPVSDEDTSAEFLRIRSLDIQDHEDFSISNIFVRESQLSFVTINAITGMPETKKTVYYQDIVFEDLNMKNSKSLISTKALLSEANFGIELSNLKMQRIKFEKNGKILNFQHQLMYPVILKDSYFHDINSSYISVETYTTTNKVAKTQVQFDNMTVDGVVIGSNSFIVTSQESYTEILNSFFTRLSTIEGIYGIIQSQTQSEVNVKDSIFTENSFWISGMFEIESKSIVKCTN